MNGKKMALIVGLGLCGLTAFGYDYLYDGDGRIYDLGNASYRVDDKNIIAYNVKVNHYYYTNEIRRAVIFYNRAYGYVKIFMIKEVQATTFYLYVIETKPRSSGLFGGRIGSGSGRTDPINLSFEPIYNTLSEQPVLDNGLANGGESAPAPVGTLNSDENISVPKGTVYMFSAVLIPGDFYCIFYVNNDAVLDYFPQSGANYEWARGMSVKIYYKTDDGMHVYTNDGIFYGFQRSPGVYQMYFTVFPGSGFQVSFSILSGFFDASDENSLEVFTDTQRADIAVQYRDD